MGWQGARYHIGLKGCRPQQNKFGTVVSAAVSQKSASRYEGSFLQKWNSCMKDAREILGFGCNFVKMGQGADGEELRRVTKLLMRERHGHE